MWRSSSSNEELRATLIEHLEELRQRLFRIIGFLAVGFVAGWFLALPVYKYLEDLVKENVAPGVPYESVFITMTAAFMLQIKMAFYIGLFLTLPFTVHQLWGFVAPGLRPNERKPFKIVAPISTVLFFMGAGACWFILPVTVTWLTSFSQSFPETKMMLEAGSMVFLLIKMILSFGIGFQMPIVVFVLARLEIVTPQAMMKYWRHAVVGVVVASAIITPSGDPLSLAVLSVPLIALFFASVYVARWSLRKQRSKEDAVLDDLD
jgi:sec-independent protein translocase protein TatC